MAVAAGENLICVSSLSSITSTEFIFMIENDMQFEVTCKKRAEFKAVLAELKEKKDINPLLKEIQTNALIAQIEMFEEEMEEYKISNGQTTAATQSI